MLRRDFVLAAGGAALASAAPSASATVLYADRGTKLDQILTGPKSPTHDADLWVRAADLPRINGFELKPQGACRADVCIPVPKNMKHGSWFNLSGFARKTRQAEVSEPGVYSFGEIPELSGKYLESRLAPDFNVADRSGRAVHLSDFRGKKVLIVTWASW